MHRNALRMAVVLPPHGANRLNLWKLENLLAVAVATAAAKAHQEALPAALSYPPHVNLVATHML